MRVVIIAVAVGLTSCSMSEGNICEPVPLVEDDIGQPADFATNMQTPAWLELRAIHCIHRWSYRLAPSPDAGPTVAKAAMQACEGPLSAYVGRYAADASRQVQQAYAPGVVGENERSEYEEQRRTEKLERLERETNFRVQQARAGRCKPPK